MIPATKRAIRKAKELSYYHSISIQHNSKFHAGSRDRFLVVKNKFFKPNCELSLWKSLKDNNLQGHIQSQPTTRKGQNYYFIYYNE